MQFQEPGGTQNVRSDARHKDFPHQRDIHAHKFCVARVRDGPAVTNPEEGQPADPHGLGKGQKWLFLDSVLILSMAVMPGSLLYDFGDIIRSNCSGGCAEDEIDARKVKFDINMFSHLMESFLDACIAITTPLEVELLHMAGFVITYEQALRFLGDFLAGDVYYKLAPDSNSQLNLVRARTQIALLRSMERSLDQMQGAVRRKADALTSVKMETKEV